MGFHGGNWFQEISGIQVLFCFQRFPEIFRDFSRIRKGGFVEAKRHFFVFPEIFRDFQRFFSVKTDLSFFHESKISENHGATKSAGHAGFQWSASGPGLHFLRYLSVRT